MTDPTVVSLCREYLAGLARFQEANVRDLLFLLCDRLEEVGFEPFPFPLGGRQSLDLAGLRRYFQGGLRYTVTIPRIMKMYGGES